MHHGKAGKPHIHPKQKTKLEANRSESKVNKQQYLISPSPYTVAPWLNLDL